jgi:predicted Zn-dependent protease
VAALVDALTRTLLTSTAARRPEVAARLALGAGIAAELLTLVDDPTAPGAYGAYAFDDEGELGAPLTLVDRGHLVARLADRVGATRLGAGIVAGRGRRAGHIGALHAAPSHLRLAAGTVPRASLYADDGLVLEGGGSAIVDPISGRVVVAASRARELVGGHPTGRVYADVELVGELADLLGSVSAVAAETQTFAIRDDLDGLPRWRSLETPWLRGAGMVRARRRPT